VKNKLSCFVIIGFGKKTSYANGKARVLDLDQTYSLLLKPVFDSLNIDCYRAIDKNLNGSIDKVMLQEIKNADIAIADISTLNANVMWELGVRHSLKPNHTIMICEKEQMSNIPFDINHFVVHQYTHSEEGIPYMEVERFRTVLSNLIKGLLEQNPAVTDSPVFTFLENELKVKDSSDSSINADSFATIMGNAEKAKNNKEYEKALEFLAAAKKAALVNMTFKDSLSFIISRQALCTYKSKKPNELEALQNAKKLLDELQPEQSQDIEVLGLSGAINKRLNEISDDINYLDSAIGFYERGFNLKQDYYNGINLAYMLYKKTAQLVEQKQDWEDIKLKADYIRNSVLEICLGLEEGSNFSKSNDAIWVLLTIAEVYNYKNKTVNMNDYEDKADALAKQLNDTFALGSYYEQKVKIKVIMEVLNK
jgi:hypothetical protein